MAALIAFVIAVTGTQVTAGPQVDFVPAARALIAYVEADVRVERLVITAGPEYLDDGQIVCGWAAGKFRIRLFTGDICGPFTVGSLYHELGHAAGERTELGADRWAWKHVPDRWRGDVRRLLESRGTLGG